MPVNYAHADHTPRYGTVSILLFPSSVTLPAEKGEELRDQAEGLKRIQAVCTVRPIGQNQYQEAEGDLVVSRIRQRGNVPYC
jgi:hypothetical protein